MQRLTKAILFAHFVAVCLCCTKQSNFDILNNDLDQSYGNPESACCKICEDKQGCVAYSWTDYSGGTCWLKSGTAPIVPSTKASIGIIDSNDPFCACQQKINMDISGNDLSSVSGKQPNECCGVCKDTVGCMAFAWNDYLGGTCWLKWSATPTISNPGVLVGEFGDNACKLSLGMDIKGNDLQSISGQDESSCCSLCKDHDGCVAFSYSSFQDGTCWLKSATGPLTASTGSSVRILGSCPCSCPVPDYKWKVYKNFDMSNMESIREDWNIILWNPGNVNNEKQAYVDSPETLFIRNNRLIIRAYRKDDNYYSARLHSKIQFSPALVASKRMRVEYVAKVPTVMGAWAALWMLGIEGVYGTWPQEGEIDLMEWVYQLDNDIKSSLHWNSGQDWMTDYVISKHDIMYTDLRYGMEYSAYPNNEYVQFYIVKPDGEIMYGKRATHNNWKDTFNGGCSSYIPGATKCSPLAPFDNKMYLIMNFAVGGDWGGCCGVDDYSAFDAGVEMDVKSAVIYVKDDS